MDSATVKGIVDHHKLGDVTTSSPLEAWIWPVGCTCTVIKNMYDFYNVEIPAPIDGTSMRDLVFRDYKDFDMNGKKVGIGQLEVVDLAILDNVKDGLIEEIALVKEEGQRHSVFLLLTDIMKEGSEMLIISDDPSVVEDAFDVKCDGKSVWLPGVMSRKKQVVPNFEKAFKK